MRRRTALLVWLPLEVVGSVALVLGLLIAVGGGDYHSLPLWIGCGVGGVCAAAIAFGFSFVMPHLRPTRTGDDAEELL